MVENPYVKAKAPAPANASADQPASLEVTNPYVAAE